MTVEAVFLSLPLLRLKHLYYLLCGGKIMLLSSVTGKEGKYEKKNIAIVYSGVAKCLLD